MIAALSNHLWQSTAFAAAAGLLALLLRANRASVRHGLWMAASLKFLLPFSLLMTIGAWLAPAHDARAAAPAGAVTVSHITEPFAQPFFVASTDADTAPLARNWLSIAAGSVWALGLGAIAVARVRGWRRVRRAVRAGEPAAIAGITLPPGVALRSSSDLLEPAVVGWWRPVLVVPQGIELHLTSKQLQAVVTHEMHHIRRRDNLTAALHMLVEAAFWFHPLVWWIGARLVDERERACDEHVLRACGEPHAYAEGILNVCRRYVESPLTCVPGVTGSDLRKRLEAIMINRVGRSLNGARRALLVAAAIAAIALPVIAGRLTAPLRAQTPADGADGDQKFEVASVKPCEMGAVVPGARSGGGGSGSFSPGRVHLDCFVVKNLIDQAYVANRDAKNPNDVISAWPGLGLIETSDGPQRIRGGPAWVYSDKYTIEAKMPGPPSTDSGPRSPERVLMLGPMLRVLLEERFQLKLHQETEVVPMFALTVAKSGLKIAPMKEGDCTIVRSNGPILPREAAQRGVKPTCGAVHAGPDGPNWRIEHAGQDLGVVAAMLSSDLGVKIIDQTGVTDKFNISWEYGPDENTPGSMGWMTRLGPQPPEPPTAPSVFTALEQQLGLKLVPIKGPRGYLVIDHIERPAPDAPAEPPARAKGPGR